MARIRTIKPEFWADEKLGPMPALYRLVFLGLVSIADDAGRLVDSTKQIDAALFPYTADTCVDALAALASAGRIERGESESGQKLIQIVNWERHQKIDHPAKYTLPPITQRECREGLASGSRDALAPILDLRPTTYDRGPTSDEPRAPAHVADGFAELTPHLDPLAATALARFCRAAKQPFAVVAGVRSLHEMDGYAWPVVSRALVEFAADARTSGFNARGMRAFCASIKNGDTSGGETAGEQFLRGGNVA